MVSTADRVQAHGIPGRIQIARVTYALLKDDFVCAPRGVIDVKGKGNMQTWFVVMGKPYRTTQRYCRPVCKRE